MAEIYRHIAYELESELRQMRLEGKTRLPTEEELCKKYSCSRQTVRSALELLAQKGLITKKHGSGSYISDTSEPVNNTVILIIEDEDEYIYPDLISSLGTALNKKGFDLKILPTNGSLEKERDALSEAMSSSPAAVMIEPISNILPDHNISLIEAVKAKGIPVIYLFTSYDSPSDAICIKEDNAEGSKMLVHYLKEHGHINISCIFRCDDSRGLDRYKGYVEGLFENGLPFDEKRVCFFTGSDRKNILSGRDDFLVKSVMSLPSDVTSVICHNDEIAYRLIKALEKTGRSDVAVVSFDNSYYSSGSSSITSLGHNSREFTAAATEAVLAGVCRKGGDPAPIRWHLHIRNSG